MGIVEPGMEAMLDVFVHETDTMLEELDEVLIVSEKAHNIDDDNINTIFRITHTIKGSAAMMNFEGMSNLAHSIEDVFYILRDNPEKLKVVFDTIFKTRAKEGIKSNGTGIEKYSCVFYRDGCLFGDVLFLQLY